LGTRKVDERGRTVEKIQAFLEVGKNPITGRMQVRPIECWRVISEPEEKK